MADRAVYLRCKSCATVNRLPADKLADRPHCGKCKAYLQFPRTPVEATAASFEEEVLRWPGIVLVEFWAEQCGVCRSIMPFIQELASRKAGILKVVLVNVEREGSLANRFEIRSTPVFMVYQRGSRINELHGALPRREMEAWIESALGI